MILGSAAILNINGIPVGCLTGNSLSESVSFINTCKTTDRGAITPLAKLHDYSIDFKAIMTTDSLMSWEQLKDLGRDRIMLNWSIVNSVTSEGDSGTAFLQNLELLGDIGEFINFTGTLAGYGAITNV